VTEQQWRSVSSGQVAQALAFVCRETFFEPVHD
jgi:hypothetical protein